MRDRKEIEQIVNRLWEEKPKPSYEYLMVELLLDIREQNETIIRSLPC